MKMIAILLILFNGIAPVGKAQYRMITGKVFNQNGEPVPKASIRVKGCSCGTVTNVAGAYRLIVPVQYDSVSCSHVSYKSTGEKINGNTVINFVLQKQPLPVSVFSFDTTVASAMPADSTAFLKKSSKEIFEKIEVYASYPGGDRALQYHINKQLKDSLPANIKRCKGEIKCGFTVTKDGAVTDVLLLKGVEPTMDAFIVAILQKQQRWTPAIQNGLRVSQYKEISILIAIQ